MLRENRACRACPRGRYENATMKLLAWNLGFNELSQRTTGPFTLRADTFSSEER